MTFVIDSVTTHAFQNTDVRFALGTNTQTSCFGTQSVPYDSLFVSNSAGPVIFSIESGPAEYLDFLRAKAKESYQGYNGQGINNIIQTYNYNPISSYFSPLISSQYNKITGFYCDTTKLANYPIKDTVMGTRHEANTYVQNLIHLPIIFVMHDTNNVYPDKHIVGTELMNASFQSNYKYVNNYNNGMVNIYLLNTPFDPYPVNGTPLSAFNMQPYIPTGTYEFKIASINGCFADQTHSLNFIGNVKPEPLAIKTGGALLCDNSSPTMIISASGGSGSNYSYFYRLKSSGNSNSWIACDSVVPLTPPIPIGTEYEVKVDDNCGNLSLIHI